ncbi:MAG: hypothetical protein C0392_12535 [Syntrophus sp. (in: bacteria)]|nr:hypothetical protein [Syntrophus sp. (in: bacteria)]
MGKSKNSFLLLAVLVLCISLGLLGIPASHTYAGEGYGTHVPVGAEDTMAGALPPAGTKVFLNYFQIYNLKNFKDNAGRNASVPGLGKVDAQSQVVANIFRYVDVTKIKLLGGDLIWDIIIPVVYQHASVSAGMVDIGRQSKTGLGDVEGGIGIQWHRPTFHNIAAFHIVAPTGAYDRSGTRPDLVNIGRNYWSFNPLWLVTYIGDKNSPIPGFEVSAKMMYFFNTINTATSYTSGQEFSADYFVGQHLGPWTFGANGNFYYQVTKDKQYGATAYDQFSGLQTGVKGRSFSVGPLVSYNLANKAFITAKYQFGVYEQNRPQGDAFWLKFILPF